MKLFTKIAAALALAVSMGTASAVTVTLDIAGVPSCDGPGGGCNVVAGIDLGAIAGGSPIELTGLGWDLNIATVGASWLSEAVISFGDTTTGEIFSLTAGVGDNFPGSMSYSSGGIVDLATALGAAPILADGILIVEFYESFDDVAGANDAFYVDPSTLTLEFDCVGGPCVAASEPGILMLFGLGLIGAVVARRRA